MTEQMDLEVNLERDGDDSWGFRLIGGKDFNMPFTVVKVVPDTPAEKAGLHNGDVICRINDSDTCDLSHCSAKQVVDDATKSLSLLVKRGLYDPVLDDYEPIYEPVDLEDFDQPSQPTEVHPFQIEQFLDPKKYPEGLSEGLTDKLTDLRDIETPGIDASRLIEPRSLAASPFVLPIKPYRPFSTEPLPEIPPLEDPIILNPVYNDLFGKLQEGDIFPETRFKLPISEQYDPDGSKKRSKNGMGSNIKEISFSEQSHTKDVTYEEKLREETKISKEMQHKSMIEEMKFMEMMKKEIDLDKIEMTAVSLVDESIKRAVSVADEIKKEINVELAGFGESETNESVSAKESKSQKEFISIESKTSCQKYSKEEFELGVMVDKTTQETVSCNESKREVCVAQEIKTIGKEEQVIDDKTLSTKQEIKETIISGSDRRKFEVIDKKVGESAETKQVHDIKAVTELREIKDDKINFSAEKDLKRQAFKVESTSEAQISSVLSSESIKQERISTSEKSDAKLVPETITTSKHRAYSIGLQTIPNIKGTIHSSYHYNLLLKTFFIHLTDVMVALSRFILTEPVFDREKYQEMEGKTSEKVSEDISVNRKEHVIVKASADKKKEETKETIVSYEHGLILDDKVSKKEDKVMAAKATSISAHESVKSVIENAKAKEDIKKYLETEETLESRILSGAKMAQLSEKKSEELTHKMDAVITEFQVKAGIEETIEAREKKSKNRNGIEEAVALKSDPLEWLSKVDKNQFQGTKEFKSESSSSSESIEKKKHESKLQKTKTLKAIEEKQMYVAIVESHVFTNKDAIFEEQVTEFSETSSVQSADETNIAFIANEAIATEIVTLENKDVKREEAKSVLEESRELAIVNSRSETVKLAQESKPIVEEVVSEKHVEIDTKAIKDIYSQEIIEPVVDLQEIKTIEIKKGRQEVDIKIEEHIVYEKSEVAIEEARHEIIEVKEFKNEEKALAIQEEKDLCSVSEITEIAVQDDKQETTEIQEFFKEQRAIADEVSEKAEVVIEEEKQEVSGKYEIKKEEQAVIIEEVITIDTTTKETDILQPNIVEVVTEHHIVSKSDPTLEEASSELKIVKEQILEVQQTLQLTEETDLSINKHTEIVEFKNQLNTLNTCSSKSYQSNEIIQESSFTARTTKSSQESKKLSLNLELNEQKRNISIQSESPTTIDMSTPATMPPSPLTDEYVFKLQIPLPKGCTAVPRDLSPDMTEPDHEDPNIVKKTLVPHIDTTLHTPIIYDPPLASPPLDTVHSPVYTKPGLKGGFDRPDYSRSEEEILEIERKSSLLASAIDETIKCIEEYKEEVGIENKKEVKYNESIKKESYKEYTLDASVNQPIIYNGYAELETKIFDRKSNDTKMSEEWNHIKKQVIKNNEALNGLKSINNELKETTNVKSHIEKQSYEKSFTDLKSCSEINSNDTQINQLTNGVSSEDSNNNNAVILNGIEERTAGSSVLNYENSIRLTAADYIDTTSKYQIEGNELKKGTQAVIEVKKEEERVERRDPLDGYRPVQFNPEELIAAKRNLQSIHLQVKHPMQREASPSYMDSSGELLGTRQGIVDALEEAVVDAEVAKELGKPGMTEVKIAELISGESEMLREAHVMGLSRVLSSHMHRPDDSSVDFKKIKPIIDSLKDSEVLKALNEELIKTREEKKKEERKWTTFMQKPRRPVPRMKFGYYGYTEQEEINEEPYKVKIVKQPKPKVAPDYKSEDFETGPLPWEERALNEPPPPPIDPEDPILIPEEVPEFFEAVDPLPESEVPDLEDSGIPLPPPKAEEPELEPVLEEAEKEVEDSEELPEKVESEAVVEETERISEEMEQNRLAEQLLSGVQNMVDPNASVNQQLCQMRVQLAALAQLPGVIQQTLELVTKQLGHLAQQENHQPTESDTNVDKQAESQDCVKETQSQTNGDVMEECVEEPRVIVEEANENTTKVEETKSRLTQEVMEKLKKEEEEMIEEQRRIEKQKKELIEQMKLEQESRQVKQRPTPRVGKPKPVFGPTVPLARPLVLPGGRKWRKPQDAYNEQFIAETLTAQAEIIRGKAKGSYESDILPYDERINFMKFEKPPVSLDHLQQSEVYKMIHNMEQTPVKRVEMLTPVIAEADYREKCRSMTPSSMDNHTSYPQQVHP